MIAIWGANGFIGRHVVRSFLSSYANNMMLFARDFESFPFSLPSSVQIYEYDFAGPDNYIEHMQDCRTIVLLVSALMARTYSTASAEEKRLNITPYQNFFEATQKLPALERVIYASSGGAVYGLTEERPVNEAHPPNPISPYGSGKLVIENLIKESAVTAPWNYTILRIANPIGVWSRKGNLVDAALRAAYEKTPLTVLGDGSTVRDYFDVRELAQAVAMVVKSNGAQNETFNVGRGKGYSVMEIIHAVEDVTGKKIDIHHNEAFPTDVPYNVLDCRKIENRIGWRAEKDVYGILKDMIEAKI